MPAQNINIQLPEEMYRRLQRVASVTQRPLEEIVFQTIRGNLPPSIDDMPPHLSEELIAMQRLRDEELWAITKEKLPPAQWRRHQHLLRKHQDAILTPAEQTELDQLRRITDHFISRRSYWPFRSRRSTRSGRASRHRPKGRGMSPALR